MSSSIVTNGFPETDTVRVEVPKGNAEGVTVYVERDEDGTVYVTVTEGEKGNTYILGSGDN